MSVTYEYRCDSCNTLHHFLDRNPTPCPNCGLRLQRVWGVSFSMGMREHYNNSVGQYVTNDKQFRDELKRQSDFSSVRTGIEHNYEPVDPSDMADPSAHGVTEEGLSDDAKLAIR